MKALKWYPIKVRGGQENKAKERIEDAVRSESLSPLFGEIFVPYQRVYTVKDGKKTIKKRHFGYIVLQGDLENQQLQEVILNVAGVYGFIAPEGTGRKYKPTPLSQKEVDNMLGVQVSQDQIGDDLKQTFSEGETVQIIDGVLKDKTAIIRKVDANRKRIEATIQIFGKETRTELAYSQVKKV